MIGSYNILYLPVAYLSLVSSLSPNHARPSIERHIVAVQCARRRMMMEGFAAVGGCLSGFQFAGPSGAVNNNNLNNDINTSASFGPSTEGSLESSGSASQVAYRSMRLPLKDYDVSIPIAMWYPTSVTQTVDNSKVKYDHRISVKRIGQMIAGWDFIPEFASRNFAFTPTSSSSLLDGKDIPLPSSPKVVFLAHGYLGSRFDLSHIAEQLAECGFVCISAEYPESLAASYPRLDGLDRTAINDELLRYVQNNLRPSSYAGIGHSLGCGTVLRMGDDSWTRVLIAGRAPEASSSPLLFISSTNDGLVRFSGPISIPEGYSVLDERNFPSRIPMTSALIFDRPDAPNHISYLSENVNEAMVSFLSPLLPVAQALSLPVLDFDKYQQSRDSVQTASILKPLISDFILSQQATITSEVVSTDR